MISWVIRTFGGEVARDKLEEYALYAGSALDGTLVRPPRLTDGPRTGSVAHDAHQSLRATTLSRADLAAFLVDVTEQHLPARGVGSNRFALILPFVSSTLVVPRP